MPAKPSPVQNNFDDQLESFINRVKTEGWDKKYSIDVTTLAAELIAQRAQRAKDNELKQAYDLHHKTFLAEQSARFQHYMEALSLLRGAHRNQPEIMKSLEGFKRPGGGSKKKKPA